MENAHVNGLVLIHKEEGMTSQTVVNRLKRLLHADKAGHTGTLDPMATGVLPVLVGRAVKASEFLLTSRKHYRANLLLGRETDTQDVTGTTLRETDEIPGEREVCAVCYGMVGESMQIPPMYSAIRVGGRRLMELARAGETIERESRPITVYRLDVRRTGERTYELDVECSMGTYIRTLCADIGKKLGCGGAMHSLCRLESGAFSLDDAYTLEALEVMTPEERIALLRPVEEVFSEYEALRLPHFYEKLLKNGCEIYQKKVGTHYPVGARLRLYDESGFYAIAEVRDYPDGSAIKSIKRFDMQ